MGFVDIDKQPIIDAAPGVRLRTPHGEKLMLSLVEIDAQAEVPLHAHPHEQAGIVLSGRMALTIGEETRELTAGDMYIIPGNTPHRAVSVNGPVQVMDVFSPIREDYARNQNAFMNQGSDETS